MSETVLIPASTGSSYTIYGTVAARDAYLLGSLRWNAVWTATGAPDDRNRASVEVEHVLDRLLWAGTPTQSYPDVQPLQWPRDGVTGVANGTTPTQVEQASYELAALVAEDPEALDVVASTVVKMVKAGTAEVEFFGPQTVGRFASRIMELLRPYLAGNAIASAAGEVFGDDGEDAFGDDDAFGLSGAL